MKRKLLLGLGLLLSAGLANAQFSPYNREIKPVLGNGGFTWSCDGISNNFAESGKIDSPLPTQSNGVLRLIGTTNTGKIDFVNSTSIFINATASGVTKFSHYSLTNSKSVAKISFKMKVSLDANATAKSASSISFTIGKLGSGLMRNSSSVYRSSNEIFSSVRWLYASGKFDFQYREGSTANTTSNLSLSNTLIIPETEYQYDFFYNNSDAKVDYVHNSIDYEIESGKIDVFVNNVKLGTINRTIEKSGNGALTDALPSIALPINSELDSYMFIQSGGANIGATDGYSIKDLSITYPSATDPTLPVSLTSFNASKTQNGIQLNWQTASEQNNSHFDVLRSTDGKNFNKIGYVGAKGDGFSVQSYNYVDAHPDNGINYYQLRQVDKNGEATIYTDKTLRVSIAAVDSRLQIKNTANKLEANVDVEQAQQAELTIINVEGQIVALQKVFLHQGVNTISVSELALSKGVYIVRVKGTTVDLKTKFIN